MVRKQYIQFPAFLVNQAEQNKPSQWEERRKKYWPSGVCGWPDSKGTAAIISLSPNFFPLQKHTTSKYMNIHLIPSGL